LTNSYFHNNPKEPVAKSLGIKKKVKSGGDDVENNLRNTCEHYKNTTLKLTIQKGTWNVKT
jgi:hypothetical protein